MNRETFASKRTSFTVKQLSELFGKSEDTIRRWKNEGVGKGADNIKLLAVENEDASGRRTSRHLVFTRAAVRDFVCANPYLMDDAPQIREFMEERVNRPEVIALASNVESMRGSTPWEEDEIFTDRESLEREISAEEESEADFLDRIWRTLQKNSGEKSEGESDGAEDESENEFTSARPNFSGSARRGGKRRWHLEEDEEENTYDRAALHYMLRLLRERERSYVMERSSNRVADSMLLRRELEDLLPDGGAYVGRLIRERSRELDNELREIRESIRALESFLF